MIAFATSGAVAVADDEVHADPGTSVATTVVDPTPTTTTAGPTTTISAPTTSRTSEPPPTAAPPVTRPPRTTVTLPPWLVGRGLVGDCDADDQSRRKDEGQGDEHCRPDALEPEPPAPSPATTPTTQHPAPTTTAAPPTTTVAGGGDEVPTSGDDDGDGDAPVGVDPSSPGGEGEQDATDPGPSGGSDAAEPTEAAPASGVDAGEPETAIAPFGNTPLVDGEDLTAVDQVTPLPPFADRFWSALPLGIAIGLGLVGAALVLVRVARLGTTP